MSLTRSKVELFFLTSAPDFHVDAERWGLAAIPLCAAMTYRLLLPNADLRARDLMRTSGHNKKPRDAGFLFSSASQEMA
ncbi:hypothetical protein XaplCFBP3122_16095 [Xanthomonas arboricola pv. populi]|uniref:Uncharacterized protein n=1 Tax=Xanthomonas arboricola pv. populi TaxID=487823 RepID=A0A2S6Z1F7_9XANT|nr:hypothetical protein XaplCFBP3122_16095 [Xanthomonas arboricola pv. populi]